VANDYINQLIVLGFTGRPGISVGGHPAPWGGAFHALPGGRLTFHVLGAVAEFERELLRERVKAGMAQARHSERHIGRRALRRFHVTDWKDCAFAEQKRSRESDFWMKEREMSQVRISSGGKQLESLIGTGFQRTPRLRSWSFLWAGWGWSRQIAGTAQRSCN